MARPRRKETAWQRRNRLARKRGYRNYYDYRVHDYGKRPPDEPVDPAIRRRAAGGRGPRALRTALRDPERVALIVEIPEADKSGYWHRMRYVVTFSDGDIREYFVPIDDQDDLDWWHDYFADIDVEFIEYESKTGHGAAAAA